MPASYNSNGPPCEANTYPAADQQAKENEQATRSSQYKIEAVDAILSLTTSNKEVVATKRKQMTLLAAFCNLLPFTLCTVA